MKTYKVCLQCINDLKHIRQIDEKGSYKLSKRKFAECANRPRCFDQPERSKREDVQNDESKANYRLAKTCDGKSHLKQPIETREHTCWHLLGPNCNNECEKRCQWCFKLVFEDDIDCCRDSKCG